MGDYLYYMINNTYTIFLRFKDLSVLHMFVCVRARMYMYAYIQYIRARACTYYTKITELYCRTYLMHEHMEENIILFYVK